MSVEQETQDVLNKAGEKPPEPKKFIGSGEDVPFENELNVLTKENEDVHSSIQTPRWNVYPFPSSTSS